MALPSVLRLLEDGAGNYYYNGEENYHAAYGEEGEHSGDDEEEEVSEVR